MQKAKLIWLAIGCLLVAAVIAWPQASPTNRVLIREEGSTFEFEAIYLSGLGSMLEYFKVSPKGGTSFEARVRTESLRLKRIRRDGVLSEWKEQVLDAMGANQSFTRSLIVTFLDSSGKATNRQFNLTGAWPSQYEIATSTEEDVGAPMEYVTIAYTSLQRIH
jgi:hypothetical protein